MPDQHIIDSMTPEQIARFRVSIFGSARTQPSDPIYTMTHDLAKALGEKGIDVVTGGGPGVMLAANEGHRHGSTDNESQSIGLTVKLPHESENGQLDMREHFQKFSNRLDTFMKLSNVVVVMPGGIGTCLELFYTWQLVQVGHICNIPILLLGDQWPPLLEWVKTSLLEPGRMSPKDMDMVCAMDNPEDALKLILETQATFEASGGEYCINLKKYQ